MLTDTAPTGAGGVTYVSFVHECLDAAPCALPNWCQVLPASRHETTAVTATLDRYHAQVP